MKNRILLAVLMVVCALPVVAADKEEKVDDRINEAANVILRLSLGPAMGGG